MKNILYKEHWEKVYQAKNTHEMTWFQDNPEISMNLIKGLKLKKEAKIIDVGGGDSKLVDFLLDEGFENIYVLDISEIAINKAKKRLGEKAKKVTWFISDILDFKTNIKFDLWHDRATFHFLTKEEQINTYLKLVSDSIIPKGYFTIGTFSESGPDKCSGIEIKKYSELSMTSILAENFNKEECFEKEHITPLKNKQNFLFCVFRRK